MTAFRTHLRMDWSFRNSSRVDDLITNDSRINFRYMARVAIIVSKRVNRIICQDLWMRRVSARLVLETKCWMQKCKRNFLDIWGLQRWSKQFYCSICYLRWIFDLSLRTWMQNSMHLRMRNILKTKVQRSFSVGWSRLPQCREKCIN